MGTVVISHHYGNLPFPCWNWHNCNASLRIARISLLLTSSLPILNILTTKLTVTLWIRNWFTSLPANIMADKTLIRLLTGTLGLSKKTICTQTIYCWVWLDISPIHCVFWKSLNALTTRIPETWFLKGIDSWCIPSSWFYSFSLACWIILININIWGYNVQYPE